MARRCCDLVPDEVLEEVFSWLPPESLIRFKCVSKSWYGLINLLMKSPAFVNKHLHNIDKKILGSTTTCLVFCCPRPGYCPKPELDFMCPFELFSLFTIFHGDDNESDHLNYVSEDFDLPIPPRAWDMTTVLACHCNGIIYLDDYRRTVMLCNPAIKECRTLPKTCLDSDGFRVLGAGFCYDSRAKDYKVIRFGPDRILPDRIENPKPRAEVYSMGADSWREIGIHLEFDHFPLRGKGVFCKGVFYWSMWANRYFIVSFDVFDEVFRSIPLPDNLLVTPVERIKLAVWNESLALFHYHIETGTPDSVNVWVLNDCFADVKASYSWIKKQTIGFHVDVAIPWTFWKNDELLIEVTDGGLISYNLRSQILRNLTIQGAGRIGNWVFSYVKSLVSVHGV